MSHHSRTSGACKGDLLRAVAEALAPHLRDILQPVPTPGPAYYSQHDSPLGRRRHLELARTGVRPRKKIGRLVLVPREAIHAYIDAHAPPEHALPDEGEDVLAEWGLRPGGRP